MTLYRGPTVSAFSSTRTAICSLTCPSASPFGRLTVVKMQLTVLLQDENCSTDFLENQLDKFIIFLRPHDLGSLFLSMPLKVYFSLIS